MRHREEKRDDKGAGNREGVGHHTEKVRQKDGEEKVEQHNEVLLFADVQVFLRNGAYKLV